MARVKGALNARKKHKKILKLARGYRGARSKQYRVAKQSVMKAMALRLLAENRLRETTEVCGLQESMQQQE